MGLETGLLSTGRLLIRSLDGRTTTQHREGGEEGMCLETRGLGGLSDKPCTVPLSHVCV